MTTLPDIPRLYTALAEVLAALLYAHRLPPRMDQRVIWGVEAGWAVLLGAFLQATGKVPLAWWIPCMAMAILSMLLFLWVTRSITLLEAGYVCARAFILAELAASVEWQLHCVLWPQRGGAEPLSLLLLAVVYGGIFTAMLFVENRRPGPAGAPGVTAGPGGAGRGPGAGEGLHGPHGPARRQLSHHPAVPGPCGRAAGTGACAGGTACAGDGIPAGAGDSGAAA